MSSRIAKQSLEADPHGAEEDRPVEPKTPVRSIIGKLDRQSLHVPQGPDSGINALIGKWPGDESEEEILALLEEMS
ncbi:MAG: hypothetical protein QOF89_2027 [Acidobacteriota bacterium]|jgi:hypothetical protein|nr:hypothetical protein [Acidobacteriota bacterium]